MLLSKYLNTRLALQVVMRLVDIHAHLDYPPLDDRVGDVVQRAEQAGVKAILSNGTSPQSNRKVLALAKQHRIVQPALGFYPTHLQETTFEKLQEELEFIAQQKNVLALGEVGLDKKFDSFDMQKPLSSQQKKGLFTKQQRGFEEIIALAEKKRLPLIVHSRKAELDAIEMLESSSAKKIIMHCFTGKKKFVQRIRENGWSFSIPVTLLKLQQFQELVINTPVAQLFTETDAPFLGPYPDKPNEPANVALTVKKIAQLKGNTVQETADQLFFNYQRLFL